MSQKNVEIVRRAGRAFNREDARDLSAISDEDLEFVSALNPIDVIAYRGPDLWMQYFARMRETWDDWRLEDLRVFDAGDDRAAAVFRLVGKGKTSGAPVDHEIGLAYTFRNGKLWRMRSYLNPDEALEAVGLRE